MKTSRNSTPAPTKRSTAPAVKAHAIASTRRVPASAGPISSDDNTVRDGTGDRSLAGATLAGGRLSDLVVELWQRTRMDWGFVTDRLAQAFRKERWVGARERRFVAETLYGMVRMSRTLDAALGARATDQDRLAAYFLRVGALGPSDLAPSRDWAAVAQLMASYGHGALRQRLTLGQSLPDWLADALIADYGERAHALALSLNERAPMAIRVNRMKGTRTQLLDVLAAEGLTATTHELSEVGIIIQSRTNLFGTRAFSDGWFEAQDIGSQLLAELATPNRPGSVLDYCAGAGGKTLAIGAALGGRGRLVATDIDDKKLTELRRRAKRAGLPNVNAVSFAQGAHVLDAIMGRCDTVLVDAPCTGIGALRRNPEARWRLQASDVPRMVAEQREITLAAARYVAPGGRLIYATCSLLAAENQDNAEWLTPALAKLGFAPMRLDAIWGERALTMGNGRYLQVAPDTHGTDGFFAAVFARAV